MITDVHSFLAEKRSAELSIEESVEIWERLYAKVGAVAPDGKLYDDGVRVRKYERKLFTQASPRGQPS